MSWFECTGGSGGGGGSDYSTTEHIVGTWVDGNPIYEITLLFTPTGSSYTVDLSSLGIDTVISFNGVVKQTSGNIVPLCYSTGSGDFAFAYYDTDSDRIKIAYGGNYNLAPWIVTIRYTKSST